MQSDLQQFYGNIDIYLFDQLLKGTYNNCNKVLDAGCGGGRNLAYFLRNGFEVYGVDRDADAINAVKELSALLSPNNSSKHFKVATAEKLPFKDNFFDLLLAVQCCILRQMKFILVRCCDLCGAFLNQAAIFLPG